MVLPEVTTFDEARQIIREQAEEIEKLSNELAWFKRQMFGSKTEHYIPEDNTPSLFPEEESPEPSKEVQTATVSEHERKPNMNGKFVSRTHFPRFPPTCRVKNA